jgi:serralysin
MDAFFTGLLRDHNEFTPAWACACSGCGSTLAEGAGGATPGGFATTPGDNAYRYVGQMSMQGDHGGLAPLLAGSRWTSLDATNARTVVTYSFADPATSVFSYGGTQDFAKTLTAFSAEDRALVRTILDRIASVANVEFVEVADNAQTVGVIRYGYSLQPEAMNYAGYAFYPSHTAAGGDVWLAASQAQDCYDFYRPNLLLHETLHALGLKHPFGGGAVLPAEQDIIPNTVMSYSPVAGGSGTLGDYPAEPMAFDIAALQHLYGAAARNAGDTVYDLAAGEYQNAFRAIWDSAGNDTLDACRIATGVDLDLSGHGRSAIGTAVSVRGTSGSTVFSYEKTLSIAPAAVIENARGTASGDRIAGNAAANQLSGGAGNDTLAGRGGNDLLDGGDGTDTVAYEASRGAYQVTKLGTGWQVVDRSGAEGTDQLAGVERIRFADGGLALDFDGCAGTVARVLGLAFGAPVLQNAGAVGVCLSVLDSGLAPVDLMQAALNIRLGAGAANGAVVDLICTNLLGTPPEAALRDALTGLLDAGAMTQAQLALVASNLPVNADRIGLAGLVDSGLAYAL